MRVDAPDNDFGDEVPGRPNCPTVARNLIGWMGVKNLRKLIKAWKRGVPDAKLGVRYATSEQRVGQWRRALGTRRQRYVIHPEIRALLHADGRGELFSTQEAETPRTASTQCLGVNS